MRRNELRYKEDLERRRFSQYGPPPVNYFKVVRESNDLTLEQLARSIGISKQALIRLEQGTFDRPLPAVLDYYVKNFEDSELVLIEAYEEFQAKMRARHYHYFGDSLEVDLDSFPLVHPFRQFRHRIAVNPTEVAKALCIPQATITYWERKFKLQQTVPKIVVNVLREIGYTGTQVGNLCEDYRVFRDRTMGRQELLVTIRDSRARIAK